MSKTEATNTNESRTATNLALIRDYCDRNQCTYKELLKDPDVDQSLKEWIYAKSTSIRKGSLPDSELALCRQYGIDFDLHLYTWDDWCRLLKDYLTEHHTDVVPDYYKIDKTYYLPSWAKRQARLYRDLTPEQQQKLRDTGLRLRAPKPVGRVNFVTCNGVVYRSIKDFATQNNLSYTRTQQKLKNGKSLEQILEERDKLVFSGIHVTYEGQSYDSVKDFAEAIGMPYSYAVYHLRHSTPEETVQRWQDQESRHPGTSVTYNGKTYDTIKQFAADQGLNYALVVSELRKHKTPEEVVAYLTGEHSRTYNGKQITYNGTTFRTLKEFCEYYSIPYSPTSTRLSHGWTLEEVLDPSLHKKAQKVTKKDSLDEWLELQEASGNPKKLYEAAMVYLKDKDYRNPGKAVDLLLRGYNYIFSKSVLGKLYYNGTLVTKNLPAAIRCLEDFSTEAAGYPSRFTPDFHSGIPRTVHAELLDAYYQDALTNDSEESLDKLTDLADKDDLTAEQYLYKYYTAPGHADARHAQKYRGMIAAHEPDPQPPRIKKPRKNRLSEEDGDTEGTGVADDITGDSRYFTGHGFDGDNIELDIVYDDDDDFDDDDFDDEDDFDDDDFDEDDDIDEDDNTDDDDNTGNDIHFQ